MTTTNEAATPLDILLALLNEAATQQDPPELAAFRADLKGPKGAILRKALSQLYSTEASKWINTAYKTQLTPRRLNAIMKEFLGAGRHFKRGAPSIADKKRDLNPDPSGTASQQTETVPHLGATPPQIGVSQTPITDALLSKPALTPLELNALASATSTSSHSDQSTVAVPAYSAPDAHRQNGGSLSGEPDDDRSHTDVQDRWDIHRD